MEIDFITRFIHDKQIIIYSNRFEIINRKKKIITKRYTQKLWRQ